MHMIMRNLQDGEGPMFETCLSPFRIGKYEVSGLRAAVVIAI